MTRFHGMTQSETRTGGPLPSYRKRVTDATAMAGLALGYLGLVIILSLTPALQSMMAPLQYQANQCTEFGGSR